MGKPGGFFKKLKAKQKREASRQRRGTSGASKEERRAKQHERVEYFAAKREAEELAAVSSSSDSEPSTDSDKEMLARDRKLLKLRKMLGIRQLPSGAATAVGGAQKRWAKGNKAGGPSVKRRRTDAVEGRGEEEASAPDFSMVDSDAESSGIVDSTDGSDSEVSNRDDDVAAATGEKKWKDKVNSKQSPHTKRAPVVKRRNAGGDHANDLSDDDDDLADGGNEDWETFLGGSIEDEEGSEEFDEDDDDEDRLSESDLLIDSIGNDGEDEENGDVNPFFELLEDGHDDAEDEEDLIDPEEFEEEEDDEADEEDSGEDAYVDDDAESLDDADDDDDDDDDDRSNNPRASNRDDEESRALLPQFQLGTTSLDTLKSSGAITSPDDPWYLKYHVDARKEVDRTPLQPVPIEPAAAEALEHTNDARIERARRREAEDGASVTRKDVHFVTANDYEGVHPENVSVAATEAARAYLQRHPPFSASTGAAVAAASSTSVLSSSQASSLTMATEARTARPPYMHPVLWEKWVDFRLGRTRNDNSGDKFGYYRNTAGDILTSEERGFVDMLQGYADIMDCTRCWQNGESRRELFVLHMLNHWFKARSVVVAHDKMLAAHKERRRRRRQRQLQQQQKAKQKVSEDSDSSGRSGGKSKNAASEQKRRHVTFSDEHRRDEENEDGLDDDDDDLELRDRGFGKTRLLVMLPMRSQAYEYVNTFVRVLGADPEGCPKLGVFEQDFTEVAEAMDPTFKRRPREYQRQFAGNIDDSFCVGLRLEPNRVHVYAHPLNSDVILCSPLGLRRRLEKNGDVLVSLSAIEVCVIDEAHVLLEQNWQQVTAVMELLNKRPTDTTHGLSDLRRVYAWALEGKSGRHRQTIISTDISNATILSTFRSTVNTFGKVVLQHRNEPGVLGKVLVPIRQHFLRFEPASLETVDDDRYNFFTTNVYPTKVNPVAERDVRTILVVPSYVDFVRLRNYMHREYRESFTAISEYTSVKQQRRALGQFSDLERPVLLLTERFYFFKRYFVKHAEVLVFYSPPLFPAFYASLINKLVATSPNAFAMTLFSQYDSHELNRLVGTSRMRHLLERESGIFSFVTS